MSYQPLCIGTDEGGRTIFAFLVAFPPILGHNAVAADMHLERGRRPHHLRALNVNVVFDGFFPQVGDRDQP